MNTREERTWQTQPGWSFPGSPGRPAPTDRELLRRFAEAAFGLYFLSPLGKE